MLMLASSIFIPAYAEDGTNGTPPEPPTGTPEGDNSTVQGEGSVTDPEIITELLAQANESRVHLMAALFVAYGDNYSQSALNNLVHGDDAVNKSEKLLEQANLNAAAQQVRRAMKQYRNALRKAEHDNPEAIKEYEESWNTTEPDPPPPDEPDVNETEIMETKLMLIQQFQENFQERVMSMEMNVNSLMNQLSDKDSQKAGDALERTERKLLRIQERLNRGDVDGAMEELENATEGMDEALDSFEDDHTAQMLRTMDKLEARVQRMVDKMNRKAARGMDTSGDEDAINQAWGQIKKYQEDFQSGKSGSAPGQIKDNGNGNGNGKGKGKGHDKPDKEK
jgi:tetratricopeptide (TPR) repeat protein